MCTYMFMQGFICGGDPGYGLMSTYMHIQGFICGGGGGPWVWVNMYMRTCVYMVLSVGKPWVWSPPPYNIMQPLKNTVMNPLKSFTQGRIFQKCL